MITASNQGAVARANQMALSAVNPRADEEWDVEVTVAVFP